MIANMIANTNTDILNSDVGMMLLISIVLAPVFAVAAIINKVRGK